MTTFKAGNLKVRFLWNTEFQRVDSIIENAIQTNPTETPIPESIDQNKITISLHENELMSNTSTSHTLDVHSNDSISTYSVATIEIDKPVPISNHDATTTTDSDSFGATYVGAGSAGKVYT